MINSLLSISIEATIFDIFIILGVVIAASLIVYFIWEAVLTYSKKQKGGSASSNKVEANKQEGFEEFHFDGEQNKEDPKLLEEGNVVDVQNENQEQEEQTESDEERLNRERREYLEKRRQELIKRIQEENEIQEQEQSSEEKTTEEVEEVEEPVEEEQEEINEDTTES